MATLYITDHGVTLSKTDGRIIVRKERKLLEDIPAFQVSQVVIFGNAYITTPAVNFFLEKGIDVAYLSSFGKYRGRLQPGFCKDAALRQKQYQRSLDPQFCLNVSKQIVTGKIRNMIAFCQRQRKKGKDVTANIKMMEQGLKQVSSAANHDSLWGYEGTASATYFKLLRAFLHEDWGFNKRIAHPPTDPINILLSLGYTLLYNDFFAAINIVGLDPYMGFFHQARQGHATMASDLMEEFKAIIVDSVVLSAVNKGAIKKGDFNGKNGHIVFSNEGLKRFLLLYDQRVDSIIFYPTLQSRNSYHRCFELQVRHLARVIQGEDPAYHPFKTK